MGLEVEKVHHLHHHQIVCSFIIIRLLFLKILQILLLQILPPDITHIVIQKYLLSLNESLLVSHILLVINWAGGNVFEKEVIQPEMEWVKLKMYILCLNFPCSGF